MPTDRPVRHLGPGSDDVRSVISGTDGLEETLKKYQRPDPVKIRRYETRGNLQGFSFRSCRLSDPEYRELHACALPLQSSEQVEIMLARSYRRVTLGHFYVTFLNLTGDSSRVRDTYKSAFSFPFLFVIERESRAYDYLVVLANYRSYVETSFHKLVLPGEPRIASKEVLRPPIDEELSATDIDQISEYFWGLVEGYTSTISMKMISPFARSVKSNLVIFGFQNNKIFEEHFRDEHAFNDRMAELEPLERSE